MFDLLVGGAVLEVGGGQDARVVGMVAGVEEEARRLEEDADGRQRPHQRQPRHRPLQLLRLVRRQRVADVQLVADLLEPRDQTALLGAHEVAELEHGQRVGRPVAPAVLAPHHQLLHH